MQVTPIFDSSCDTYLSDEDSSSGIMDTISAGSRLGRILRLLRVLRVIKIIQKLQARLCSGITA